MTVPDAKPTVLMVEDRADVLHGHFPKLFAEFAEGFADAGCEIHVLTSLGWPRDRGDNRFVLHRYGVLAATIHRLSRACQELSHRLEHHRGLVGRLSALLYRCNELFATLALVGASRWLIARRRLAPVGIVVFSVTTSPRILDRLAGSHRWIVKRYLWTMPRDAGPSARRSGKVGLACPARELGPVASGYRVFEINLGASRRRDRDPTATREELGLPADGRVALLIGSGHAQQNPGAVTEVLRDREDVTTVILGRMADQLDAAEVRRWARPPVLVGGFVDPVVIDRHIDVADVVVVSLQPGFPHCSSVLLDAVSGHTPAIVSSPSLPASWVEEYGAGEVFDSGSSASFAAALDRLDLPSATAGAVRLNEAMLGEVMARRYLAAFEELAAAPARR